MNIKSNHHRQLGRPRSADSRDSILKATNQLLEEVGFSQLTIEGIAARAGVAKTTIYRWWSSKGSIAIEAFLESTEPRISFPETKSAVADIREQVKTLAGVYQTQTGKIITELIAMGQDNPDTLRLFIDGYVTPRRTAAKAVLQRAVKLGEIRVDVDLDVLVDALYGPIFHRLLLGHARLDAAFAEANANLVLAGAAPN
ncbi:MAG TPA: TetR/AcrR family transcriptional regulator [Burkholderiaceae bacterium]|jgi:AcrR family transcriptional regulator|nr:TetR/AcrR family transcriptional regulator [Burkholderiaceae bacterium]